MTERPILFSAPMVRAILDGRKTQTRRVVKPAPKVLSQGTGHTAVLHEPCRYGKPGDRLWVRETWGMHDQGFDTAEESTFPVYRADTDRPEPKRWRPSIHMPRSLCRLVLEITDVRMERLQDISDEDAIAEGCRWVGTSKGRDYYSADSHAPVVRVETFNPSGAPSAPEAFKALWNSINGPESWEANPWVWVLSFRPLATSGGSST